MIEKDMEDLIAAYPDDFFPRRNFVLIGRQRSFAGCGRFDLAFEDEFKSTILMELKASAIEKHLCQIMDLLGYNPPLCINKQQLREGFAIIDRALEIMDKSGGKLDELRGPRRPGSLRLEHRVNYGDDWGCFARPSSDSANARIKYVDEAQENPT